jgi:hypothetical protein
VRLAGALLAVATLTGGCGSDEGCEFDFAHDAVTFEDIPWICSAGGVAPDLTILFRPDESGLLDGAVPFTWSVTSCRTTALTFASRAAIDLFEVGGNVAVGRLTFVIDGATYLCGYGVPPP